MGRSCGVPLPSHGRTDVRIFTIFFLVSFAEGVEVVVVLVEERVAGDIFHVFWKRGSVGVLRGIGLPGFFERDILVSDIESFF